jgi:hypothetical protein
MAGLPAEAVTYVQRAVSPLCSGSREAFGLELRGGSSSLAEAMEDGRVFRDESDGILTDSATRIERDLSREAPGVN